MKKIYSTQDRIIIHLLKSKLAEENIFCIIKNDQPPLAGEIPAVIAPPELWVMDDKNFAAATHIVERELAEITTAKERWQCTQCHEWIEGQFNVCWKCGNSR